MNRIIGTIAATVMLAGALFVAPASADVLPDVETCPASIDGTSFEISLSAEVTQLRTTVGVLDSHIETLEAQRDLADSEAKALRKQVRHKQATIDRLRAKLRQR